MVSGFGDVDVCVLVGCFVWVDINGLGDVLLGVME